MDPTETSSRRGLTLLEILVVLAIIGILAALLLTTLSRAKTGAQTTACLNNLKQLQLCWQIYADDHGGAVPPNLSENVGGIWRSTPDSWIGESSALYDTDTVRITQGLLFKYDYNRSVSIYRYPADRSQGLGADGKPIGLPRTRSYSMSGCFGGRTGEVQAVIWDISLVDSASRVFVFIDEHENSVDDAHFLTWPNPDDRWVNMPTDRHQRGCTLSFADGHVERWGWLHGKSWALGTYFKKAENLQDLADLRRLQRALAASPTNVPPQP